MACNEYTNQNVGWYSVDFTENKLYWIDAVLHSISTCDFDGENKAQLFQSDSVFAHPFGIDIFEVRNTNHVCKIIMKDHNYLVHVISDIYYTICSVNKRERISSLGLKTDPIICTYAINCSSRIPYTGQTGSTVQ